MAHQESRQSELRPPVDPDVLTQLAAYAIRNADTPYHKLILGFTDRSRAMFLEEMRRQATLEDTPTLS